MIPNNSNKSRAVAEFKSMQAEICLALEKLDGQQQFRTDLWNRSPNNDTDKNTDCGGGITRVISNGAVFEKGGVNFSEVYGTLHAEMSKHLLNQNTELPFYATGTSLVIHPYSPQVPTIHANVRYLEVADKRWVGGGIDLTPYTYNEKIFKHFHSTLKNICDQHDLTYYPKYKAECDQYFRIPHRNESRGIGGIFFDYLGKETNDQDVFNKYAEFAFAVAHSFNTIYTPIVEQTKDLTFSEQQKNFQLIRRGRYVEFNLVYDRGTLFGLKTNGRIESILMSLPLHASWQYDYKPANQEEEQLAEIFCNPKEY